MLKRGVLLPSQWESTFIGLAHLQGDVLEVTIDCAVEALNMMC